MPAKPLAILISDLHLSLWAPACRADTDWLKVQADYLEQVRAAALLDKLPILCAGDIFDRWNAPPELVNFALQHLPDKMICIPGQHDLPNHQLEDVHRSGYGVLIEAKKIVDLSVSMRVWFNDVLNVYGFGWDQDISPPRLASNKLQVALVHRYVWASDRTGFPGAPETGRVGAYKKLLRGYDVAVFGDNHIPFQHPTDYGCTIYNCGGFIRRKSDEINRIPGFGLLMSDGTIERRKYNTAKDQFHPYAEPKLETPVDVAGFIAELNKLGEQGIEFRQVVRNHLRKEEIPKDVRQIILTALDNEE